MERQPTEERKQQIANAALEIIAEEGLGKFTTAAIAKKVGLTDGALFRHFKSKQDIVLAAIGVIEDMFFKDFPPAEGDPLDRLGALVRQRLSFLLKHPFLVRLIFSRQLSQASGKKGGERIGHMQARTIKFIHACLQEAEKQGMIRDGLSADDLTLVVFGSVFAAANRDLYEGMFSATDARQAPERLWRTLETLIRR